MESVTGKTREARRRKGAGCQRERQRTDTLRLLHDRLHDEAISFATIGGSTDELRKAYEAYWEAMGGCIGHNQESVIGWRNIVAGRIVIDCIHALSHEQLNKLESELKRIASVSPSGKEAAHG